MSGISTGQGRNQGWQGERNSPGVESLWGRQITAGGAEWLQEVPKSPNNITSTFFITVHVLPKDLSFEHGGAKLASCSGCYLISLRPCHRWASFIFTDIVSACKFTSFQMIGCRLILVRQPAFGISNSTLSLSNKFAIAMFVPCECYKVWQSTVIVWNCCCSDNSNPSTNVLCWQAAR